MATKVHMEALSPTMEEGQLVRWLKQAGEVALLCRYLEELVPLRLTYLEPKLGFK